MPTRILALACLVLCCALAARPPRNGAIAAAQDGPDDAAAAFAMALRTVNGVPEPDCSIDDPEQRPCVSPLADSAPERGIAPFAVRNADGLGGGVTVMGRTPEGEWRYWFGTQQTYQLLFLPGEMFVCADGDGANLRAAPSLDAEVLAVLPHLSTVTGEAFVLTEPGSRSLNQPGAGWYHLSAPAEGWVFSTLLADAAHGDCALRDAQVRR